MMAALLAAALLLLSVASAAADPVTIGSVALTTFLGIGGYSAATAALVGTLITTAVVVGSQFALNSLMSDRTARNVSPNDPGVQQIVRQPTPKKRFVFGECMVGGAMFFYEVARPWLYIGILIADHEIEAVVDTRIIGKSVPIGPDGAAKVAPWFTGAATRFYGSYALGTDGQAIDPILAADFPDLPATFRQRGIARAVFKAHFGADRDEHEVLWGPGGSFEALLVVRGAKVYDPRDAAQRTDDPATWRWSRNAALVIGFYLAHEHGGRLGMGGIDWGRMAIAAAICDEMAPCADGTWQPRYTIDGVVVMDEQPNQVMAALLTACRGSLVQSAGRVHLVVDAPRAPVMTLHEGLLAGGFEFRQAKPRREQVNVVRTEFIAPDREYQIANGPVLADDTMVEGDGELLQATLRLPFTSDHRRAQRIARAYRADARTGRTLAAVVTLEALGLEAQDIVRVEFATFPQASGLYSVETVAFADDFSTLQLQLAEWNPEATAWRTEDEMPFTIDPVDLEDAA